MKEYDNWLILVRILLAFLIFVTCVLIAENQTTVVIILSLVLYLPLAIASFREYREYKASGFNTYEKYWFYNHYLK